MKSKLEITKIIAKYALIMIIFYLLETGVNYAYRYIINLPSIEIPQILWLSWIPIGMVILNIIAAIIVGKDIRNHQLKTNYLIVLTLVFRPLGICLFLISSINQIGNEDVHQVHKS